MTETDGRTRNDERTKENQPEDMWATGPGSGPALTVWATDLAAGGAALASNLLIAAIARTALNAPRTMPCQNCLLFRIGEPIYWSIVAMLA